MIPSFVCVLITTLCLPVRPQTRSAGEPGPEAAVRAVLQALRQDDVVALARAFEDEEGLTRAAKAWEDWRQTLPEELAVFVDPALAEMKGPDSAATMWKALEPLLPTLQKQWHLAAERQASAVERTAEWLIDDAVVLREVLELSEVLLEVVQLPLADAARSRAAVEALSVAGRGLAVGSLADLRKLPFDGALNEAGKLLRGTKAVLAAYGLDCDAVLDSAELRVVPPGEETAAEHAAVELTFELLGERRGPFRVGLEQAGGRWRIGGPVRIDLAHIVTLADPELVIEPPTSTRAAPLAWSEDPVRPFVHVLANGEIVAGGRRAPPGATADEMAEPLAWLASQAERMAPRKLPEGTELPGSPLLILADARAPFERVMTVMMLCSMKGVQISDLRLAARRPDGSPGMLAVPLPTDEGLAEAVSAWLDLRLANDGHPELVFGDERIRPPQGLEAWLRGTAGVARRRVTLAVNAGITCAQVVTVLEACKQADATGVSFAWPE